MLPLRNKNPPKVRCLCALPLLSLSLAAPCRCVVFPLMCCTNAAEHTKAPSELSRGEGVWVEQWHSDVRIVLPSDVFSPSNSHIHLLFFLLTPAEQQADDAPAPPVASAIAYLLLHRAPGVARRSGQYSLQVGHRPHCCCCCLQVSVTAVAASQVYPGSPPYLPCNKAGKPLFASSPCTVQVDDDELRPLHSHSQSHGGPQSVAASSRGGPRHSRVPAHLRLMSPAGGSGNGAIWSGGIGSGGGAAALSSESSTLLPLPRGLRVHYTLTSASAVTSPDALNYLASGTAFSDIVPPELCLFPITGATLNDIKVVFVQGWSRSDVGLIAKVCAPNGSVWLLWALHGATFLGSSPFPSASSSFRHCRCCPHKEKSLTARRHPPSFITEPPPLLP